MSKSFAIIRSPVNVLVAVVSVVVIASLSSWKRAALYYFNDFAVPSLHPVSAPVVSCPLALSCPSCAVALSCGIVFTFVIQFATAPPSKNAHHRQRHRHRTSPSPSPSACYYFTCRSLLAHYNLLAICIIFFYKALPLFSVRRLCHQLFWPSVMQMAPGRNTHGFMGCCSSLLSPCSTQFTVMHDRYQWAFCCSDYCLNSSSNLHSQLPSPTIDKLWTLLPRQGLGSLG